MCVLVTPQECILGCLSTKPSCPLCRGPVTPAALQFGVTRSQAAVEAAKAAEEAAGPSTSTSTPSASSSAGFQCESKLKALVRELRRMRATDPSAKALIFSQYNNTLEWLQRKLPEVRPHDTQRAKPACQEAREPGWKCRHAVLCKSLPTRNPLMCCCMPRVCIARL